MSRHQFMTVAPGIWHAKDHGTIIRIGKRFWATNDSRWCDVKQKPNHELVQPTIGPFKSRVDAESAYDYAIREMRAKFAAGPGDAKGEVET